MKYGVEFSCSLFRSFELEILVNRARLNYICKKMYFNLIANLIKILLFKIIVY